MDKSELVHAMMKRSSLLLLLLFLSGCSILFPEPPLPVNIIINPANSTRIPTTLRYIPATLLQHSRPLLQHSRGGGNLVWGSYGFQEIPAPDGARGEAFRGNAGVVAGTGV